MAEMTVALCRLRNEMWYSKKLRREAMRKPAREMISNIAVARFLKERRRLRARLENVGICHLARDIGEISSA